AKRFYTLPLPLQAVVVSELEGRPSAYAAAWKLAAVPKPGTDWAITARPSAVALLSTAAVALPRARTMVPAALALASALAVPLGPVPVASAIVEPLAPLVTALAVGLVRRWCR